MFVTSCCCDLTKTWRRKGQIQILQHNVSLWLNVNYRTLWQRQNHLEITKKETWVRREICLFLLLHCVSNTCPPDWICCSLLPNPTASTRVFSILYSQEQLNHEEENPGREVRGLRVTVDQSRQQNSTTSLSSTKRVWRTCLAYAFLPKE